MRTKNRLARYCILNKNKLSYFFQVCLLNKIKIFVIYNTIWLFTVRHCILYKGEYKGHIYSYYSPIQI